MNGIHDVGGKDGMGAVQTEDNEPVFHGEWDRDVFSVIGLYFASGLCPLDEFRHSIEVMDPAEYLSTPYYVHWLRAAENLGFQNGLFTKEELAQRVAELAAREMS
ncbi:nitrile hydratase subunit beta [Mycobacterium sp. 21AC1]|uniref:SH3-like domain-containing protein n=1 Tax=[Mycobacterium] appelbergii TaxID=2939269 RepID=UPI0029390D99|nr:SH3-like domain-containing protein [Mycobacterium sp. 21AC1]MDV3125325.1 nitrile hydratase subunit beta [Mycobacterium sp. 21AC1]